MAKYSHTFERIIFHVGVLVVTVAVICQQISASTTAARNSKASGKPALTSDIVLAELQEGHRVEL